MESESQSIEHEQQALLEEARFLRDNLYMQKFGEVVHDRVIDFVKELEAQFPEADKMELFHILIGSTPPADRREPGDFPEGYSILDFLRKLKKEFLDGEIKSE